MTSADPSHGQIGSAANLPQAQRSAAGRLAASAAMAAAVAAVPAAICLATLPAGLAVPFAAVALTTLILPAIALCGDSPAERVASGAAVVCVAGLMMLGATLTGRVPAGIWLRCFAVVACYACALGALATAICRARIPATGAAALTVVLAMAWLVWPAWLSPWLAGPGRDRLAGALVAPHPLFAINGAMRDVWPTPWLQHGLAYRHTSLGDDIPYRLPDGIATCALVHIAAAAILLAIPWTAQKTVRFRRQVRGRLATA